jgi:hypothetical protein
MRKRINIKNILNNPFQRKELFVNTIIATQAREGIITTVEQAEKAYDKIQQNLVRNIS